MRIFIASLAVAISSLCHAQEDLVVEVPGVTASELFRRSERWFVDAFKNAGAVVQLKDSAQKVIVGKGATTLLVKSGKGIMAASVTMNMRYAVETQCREGRCKITVNQFYSDYGEFILYPGCVYPEVNQKKTSKAIADFYLQECQQVNALIESLQSTYRTALTSTTQEGDW